MYINSMAGFSYRLMYVFLFAALVLNISNYFFVRVYNAARQNSLKAASVANRKSLPPRFWSTAAMYEDEMKRRSDSQRYKNGPSDPSNRSPHYMISDKIKTTAKIDMDDCPEQPPGLGPEQVNQTKLNVHYFKAKLDGIKPGGKYQPANCKSVQSVAIIIAYRGCRNYLTTFMKILHPFLIKQQLDYQIFVVEQSNKSEPYNRGKLLNIGFTEATRHRKDGFRCIVLHESHIVPMDTRNLYRCSWNPRQLAAVVERPTKEAYVPLLGGAIAMTPEQFLKCNGFSNTYSGNDADYYDLYYRINSSNYFVDRSFHIIGKYRTIRKGLPLWQKSQYLSTPSPTYLLDGLTSLSYSVNSFELKRLFTYLQVNFDDVLETESKVKMYDKLLNPATSKTATHRTTETI